MGLDLFGIGMVYRVDRVHRVRKVCGVGRVCRDWGVPFLRRALRKGVVLLFGCIVGTPVLGHTHLCLGLIRGIRVLGSRFI